MIRIVIDSAADISLSEAREKGVDLVPLNIHFRDFTYDIVKDENFATFYSLLPKAKEFPTTSQPTPEAFQKVFQEAKEAGDTVVAVLLSSGLSGTMQSARIAKETVRYPNIHLIDSRSAIMPLRIMVEHAVELRNAGASAEEIVRAVESLIPRAKVWGLLDTLTYLYKGGRLSRTGAIAGNLLHIKPIVTLNEAGAIVLAGKARNYQPLLAKLSEGKGFDPAFPVYFGFTGVDKTCRKMVSQAAEQFTFSKTGMFPIGGLIGSHVGPNGCTVGYIENEA